MVAEPFEVDAFGIDGAVFTAEPDPETNFKLFGPVAAAAARTPRQPAAPSRCGCGRTRILPARWKRSAGHRGIFRARLHGGVGSTIGARFTDGRSVVPFATELAVRSGAIATGADGALEAELDIALVDYLGGLAEGRLMRGDNPVLMTMELVLEVLDEEGWVKRKSSPANAVVPITNGSRVMRQPSNERLSNRTGRGVWVPAFAGTTHRPHFEQPMTADTLRIPAARLRPSCAISRPAQQRAWGMPGARCTRSLACKIEIAHERSHHRFTGNTRHSRTQWF